VALTDSAIRVLKPRDRAYKVSDAKGLYLQVTPAGGRLWRMKFRAAGGVEKKLSFGGYPEVSLKEAREQIRRVFREAFTAAGLPYFKPHSIRDTLVQFGERVCTTPEEFKAWSQNLGHENVLTTFTSYGGVAPHRQATLIRKLGAAHAVDTVEARLARLESSFAGSAVGAAR
jgi:integrase